MQSKVTGYLQLLGLRIQGDLDGITCWRSRQGGIIWFPRAPPRKPASALQTLQREKWRAILDDWNAFTDEQRANWMQLADRGHLHMHGMNLYIWWRCAQDDATIQTLEHQTGITVLP